MKIAILGSRGVPAVYGGFEVCAERLGLGLVARGHEVSVYCPRNQDYREMDYKGIKLEYAYHPLSGWGTVVFDALCLADASRKPFDVVLMLGYGASPFCVLPRLAGKAVIINTDGWEWSREKWPWFTKRWFKLTETVATRVANMLVSDSQQIQAYYKQRYSLDSEYIPYGGNAAIEAGPDRLSGLGLSRHGYYLAVMRMEPENSVEQIVDGFLRSPSKWPLVMVGASTTFFTQHILPKVNGSGNIRYLGSLDLKTETDRQKLFQLRSNAFAYVHGHTAGGTSPSLLQAMSLGALVCARKNPSTFEVAGDDAFYFDGADDLAARLSQMETALPVDLSSRRQRLAAVIEARYHWDVTTDRYLKLFDRFVHAN
ncbi:MAG: DUF1972 domain-containing protein [Elusimicrobiota bacterium]